jgi:cytochrome c
MTFWNVVLGGALVALIGSASAADGEQLFKSKCSSCHGQQKVLDGVRKVPQDQRGAHFEKFLTGHHCPDDAQRKAVLEYLLAAAVK